MIKIFLDTNVLIDIVTGREGCVDSACVLAYSSMENYELHVSTLTMATLAYYIKRHLKQAPMYETLARFNKRLIVDSTSSNNYMSALALQAKDFGILHFLPLR